MKTVLVSGVTGFAGTNLYPYLGNIFNTIGLYRSEVPEKGIHLDSISQENFDSAYAFVHLAGKAHDSDNKRQQHLYYEVNTDLTVKLFDLFLASKAEIFIFISSVKAAADSTPITLTEECIPGPKSPYGKSKLKAEVYIQSKEIPKNKRVYILRPCMIHGPGNIGNLNLLVKMIEKKVPYPLGRFKNQRSFLSVDNFCFIILQLLVKKPASGCYNLADDETFSTKELVVLIGSTLNLRVMVWSLPKTLVFLLAKIGTLLKLPFNEGTLGKVTDNYCVDNQKIKIAIGQELPIRGREGFKKSIAAIARHHSGG